MRTRDSPGKAQFCVSVEPRFPQPPRRPLPGRVGQRSIEAASCPELCIQQLGASSFSKRGRLVPRTRTRVTSPAFYLRLHGLRVAFLAWLTQKLWGVLGQRPRPNRRNALHSTPSFGAIIARAKTEHSGTFLDGKPGGTLGGQMRGVSPGFLFETSRRKHGGTACGAIY